MIQLSKHHLLWTRHAWNKGYAHKLRRMLVYEIPDEVHQELHKAVPPVPQITEWQARSLYAEYHKLDRTDLYSSLEWLIENAPTGEFQLARMDQYLFLRCHIYPSSLR